MRRTIFILFVLSLTFLAFLPILKNGFVNWDDQSYLLEDAVTQSLSWQSLTSIFTQVQLDNYHPLSRLSFALERHFFKLNPFIYHLDSLILHLLNCLLVFCFILLLSQNTFLALVTAALFGIHPVHVESVAWISERRDVLYSFFFLGSLINYLVYHKTQRKKYYYLAAGLFILALLSKAMAITLPLILIAIDYFYEHKPLKLCFKGKTLFFLIALIFGLFSLVIRIQAQDLLVGRLVNLAHNLNIAAFSILFYLNKLILPVNLSCLYPYPYNDTVFFNQTAIFNYSLLVVLSAGLVILSKYSRKIIFGVFFFLITILPVIQLIPSSGSMSVVFDRYLYLPSVGLFYALALILYWIYAKEYKYTVVVRRFIQVILVVIIAIFSALTYQRSFVWRNSLSLWNDVIKKYPGIATAYNSRGVFFMRQGEYELAHTDFLMAIKIKNEQSPGAGLKYYYNLASSLEALGRGQEAKALIASLEKNKAGN